MLAYNLMVTLLAWSVRDTLDVAVGRAMVAGYGSPYGASRPRSARGCSPRAASRPSASPFTRLTDSELRAAEAGVAPRRDKDWRSSRCAFATLEALGDAGLGRALLG